MSRMKNGSIRCDWCGRLTRNENGEYTKPDGVSAGYIVQPEWQRFPGGRTDVGSIPSEDDICEECAANRCSGCGSDLIVRATPSGGVGPFGWGGRCKACGYEWGMPVREEGL